MKIKLHKGDLPDGPRSRPDRGGRHRDARSQSRRATGSVWCNCRRATAARISCSSRATNIRRPTSSACSTDPSVLKLFHFARFDLATLRRYLGVMAAPVYCTRTASKLARTYTDKHGLKDLVKELLDIDLSKQQQSSDWGAENLDRAAARLRRQRRRVPASPEGCARRHADSARGAWSSRRPASASFPPAPSSISPAGPKATFSPTETSFAQR